MAGIDSEKAKRFERAAAELAKADKEWGRACDQLDARLESTGRDIEAFRAAVHVIDAAGHEYVNALREVVPEGD